MLATDWTGFGAPAGLLKGGLVLNGLCDLEPVVLAAGNRHLKLTADERRELSPVHRLQTVRCPVIIAWGTAERPEFKRQGMLMGQELRAAGRLAGTYVLEGINHFEIIDAMASEQSLHAGATLAMMR
ncbi:hypothetical protein [Pseudoduganella lutea]|uniref:Alpha/beta hydrolase fold domain-containing protein n=1 Tax=Pseudoduganella lutea TaxID=321985 RepID=A0A4P6L3F6_9BURK|nr:hypothetical protein [Pseudoduganella lutea]QBE65999.1 hypothetical protein EWM63_25920 [Pseudoduganella lutea]